MSLGRGPRAGAEAYPQRTMSTRRALSIPAALRALALVLAGTTLFAVTAGPVAAHSDEGQMTVVSATESEPMTISVEAGLVYAGDQHLAEEAEVWVDASTEGTQLEPVQLTRSGEGSSVYSAQFPVPTAGEWTLSLESTNPEATAQATVTVQGQPVQSTTTSVVAPTSETTTSSPATDDTETAAATEDEDEDDGLSSVVIALVVVGVLVLGAAGFAIAQRRRNQP